MLWQLFVPHANRQQRVKDRVGDEPQQKIIVGDGIVGDERDGEPNEREENPAQIHQRAIHLTRGARGEIERRFLRHYGHAEKKAVVYIVATTASAVQKWAV